jgi:hypothetical protein
VDPFNGMGMAMLISLVLFVPLILLSTKLIRLYNNINPYTKYTIHDPTSEAFATDDYGFNGRKFSISSLVYSMFSILILLVSDPIQRIITATSRRYIHHLILAVKGFDSVVIKD